MQAVIDSINAGDMQMSHLLVSNKIGLGDGGYGGPLYLAAKKNNMEMVSMLIKNGAKPNDNNKYSHPLEEAITNNNSQMAELLLKNGASVESKNQNKFFSTDSMLMIAINNRNDKIVESLIKYGAKVKENIEGEKYGIEYVTPLLFATFLAETKIANMLVLAGERPNYRSECIKKGDPHYGWTVSPIYLGYFNNMFSTVELMTRKENCHDDAWRALTAFKERNDMERVKFIISMYGRGILSMEKDKTSAITMAIKNPENGKIKKLSMDILGNKVPYNSNIGLEMCKVCEVERANVRNKKMCLYCTSTTEKNYENIVFDKLYNFDEMSDNSSSFDMSMESMDFSDDSLKKFLIKGKTETPKSAKKDACSCIIC